MCGLKWYTDGKCDHTGLPSDGSKVSAEYDGVGFEYSTCDLEGAPGWFGPGARGSTRIWLPSTCFFVSRPPSPLCGFLRF